MYTMYLFLFFLLLEGFASCKEMGETASQHGTVIQRVSIQLSNNHIKEERRIEGKTRTHSIRLRAHGRTFSQKFIG